MRVEKSNDRACVCYVLRVSERERERVRARVPVVCVCVCVCVYLSLSLSRYKHSLPRSVCVCVHLLSNKVHPAVAVAAKIMPLQPRIAGSSVFLSVTSALQYVTVWCTCVRCRRRSGGGVNFRPC